MKAARLLGGLCAGLLALANGCSGDESDDDGSAGSAAVAGSGGSAGSSGTSGSGSGTSGSTGKGGSAGTGGSAAGSAGNGGRGGEAGTPSSTGGTTGEAGANGGGEAGSGAEAGAAGATGVELVGVCAQRAEATVTTEEFAGFEEYYLIGEEGFGDDICIVRFDVMRVADAPEGCPDCLWKHTVELGIASVQVDQNGVCGSSELGLDAEGIAALEGSRVSYGFVPEADGHASIVMTYIEATGAWEGHTAGTWDDTTGFFRFDRRNGFCSY